MFYGQTLYVHTQYIQTFQTLYGQNLSPIQHMDKFFICCMKKNFMSTQNIDKVSICCMKKRFLAIQHMDRLSIGCMDKLSIYVIQTSIFQIIRNKFIINLQIQLTLKKDTLILHQQDIIFHLQNGINFRKVSCQDSFPLQYFHNHTMQGMGLFVCFHKTPKV